MSSEHRTQIISHRGFVGQYLENTIPAFEEAILARADMIELDIHETADERFIVHHDPSLDADSPLWQHLTQPQVHELTRRDGRAPLLADSLRIIGETPVDLEVKRFVDVDHLIRELADSPPAEGSFLSSFNLDFLKQLNSSGIQYPLVLIIGRALRRSVIQNVLNILLLLRPQLLPGFLAGVALDYRLAKRRVVDRFKQSGTRVYVWTVDHPTEMQKFLAWEVDGIVTNRIDLLRAVQKKRSDG